MAIDRPFAGVSEHEPLRKDDERVTTMVHDEDDEPPDDTRPAHHPHPHNNNNSSSSGSGSRAGVPIDERAITVRPGGTDECGAGAETRVL
ncbi:hypothetical protein PGTUg99_032614 [Puccinia graminis f. sp. tritici]|uniref:Uncharacterized protein n=1 Tax=Puccinia graminis f. sp. tritici TaxID=56615 RepID=A0A5B0QRX1_PUCGR|nr:hypothetical protein PGTUg99_032614 [Puccinia graminis f. sp. tritici]